MREEVVALLPFSEMKKITGPKQGLYRGGGRSYLEQFTRTFLFCLQVSIFQMLSESAGQWNHV